MAFISRCTILNCCCPSMITNTTRFSSIKTSEDGGKCDLSRNSCIQFSICKGPPKIQILFVNNKAQGAYEKCRKFPTWYGSFILILKHQPNRCLYFLEQEIGQKQEFGSTWVSVKLFLLVLRLIIPRYNNLFQIRQHDNFRS